MWNKLKNRLVQKPQYVMGIDIGTGSIKLAFVQTTSGKRVLRRCGLVELPDNTFEDGRLVNPASLADCLRKLVVVSGTACRELIFTVSGRALFVREITMPVMTEAELREALKWELDQYVPYAPDECYFDFAILGHGQLDSELRLLLVVMPSEEIDAIVAVAKEAGLRPVAIDIEPLAVARTMPQKQNALVVDIGYLSSQLVIFQAGIPVVTRTIPIGGMNFTQVVMRVLGLEYAEAERLKQRQTGLLKPVDSADETDDLHRNLFMLVTDMAREIRRTVEFYQIQNRSAVIDRLIVTGGGSKLSHLAEHLEIMLDTEVFMHDPLAGLEIDEFFDKQFVKELAPHLSVSIGLSLRGCD